MTEQRSLAAIVSYPAGYLRLVAGEQKPSLILDGHPNGETPHEPRHGGRLWQRERAGRPRSCNRATQETVSDWANGKSLVDPELVVEIERITGVSRHELRPDLSRMFGGTQ